MNATTHTASFDIAQPIERVFPLFSPEGEKRWVPDWDYVNVMGTTELSEDYVFLTKHHDHAASTAIWLVKTYDPQATLIQFYRVEPNDKVGVVTVKCSEEQEDLTHVEVTYTYIPLSEQGRKFVEGFTAQGYEQFIQTWQRLLLTYFESN